SHRTSIKDGLGRHIGSCGPLNRNFLRENIARGISFDDKTIEPGYTPLFLNVKFSQDKYKILYF
ncbi:hypothetical protein QMO12_25395, partial [Klebsiella pneumoniae]|nr:hypothetical protein [Klebsiella pneumoniae]